jgi:hypothetical protein
MAAKANHQQKNKTEINKQKPMKTKNKFNLSTAEHKNGKWVVTYDLKEIENFKPTQKQMSSRLNWLRNVDGLRKDEINENWSTGKFGADCISKIFKGDSEFEPMQNQTAEQLKFQSVRRKKKYSEDNGNLCIDRYAAGNDFCYIEKTKRPQEQTVRNIVVYISSSAQGNTDPQRIQEFVYSALNYVEQKQRAGYSVEVWHTKYNERGLKTEVNYTRNVITRTKLKESSQVIDFKRIAAASYPAMHRWIAFRSFCVIDGAKVSDTLGAPIGGTEVVRVINQSYEHPNSLVKIFDFQDYGNNGDKIPNLD